MMETIFFNNISINGRYIYGYKCLLEFLKNKDLPRLPVRLEKDIEEFVSSNTLEFWHENIEEVLPTIILNNTYDSGYYEIIEYNYYIELLEYYTGLNNECLTLIDNLLYIGINNLYGQFKSELTLNYLEDIILIMKRNQIELPQINHIFSLTIDQKNGWGNRVKMKDFL
ncbi:hypothetical protein [Chryseobacterium takakiae]|uniref:Uncharacterized protein n=1 Tax=Chryseobacterium takakiae TaxID=1302685 RepID=A0A1M4UHD1_9FLAO|nr:hypothetical protein [Chryseobacterium takakiae]SHE56156.1 hypothetical protein SAMN05444408_102110 [Chryseobacterium takakiae]